MQAEPKPPNLKGNLSQLSVFVMGAARLACAEPGAVNARVVGQLPLLLDGGFEGIAITDLRRPMSLIALAGKPVFEKIPATCANGPLSDSDQAKLRLSRQRDNSNRRATHA